ncbi:MAG: AAA family ATPase [Hydrogenophaga sp.]|uniref:ExeA family protein n=1 Tax=Hydrogenophaga sp. TaxID=1904254 RepID=UPI002AB9BFD4|nr:AAA family ATPase [Hydrogenophaga sp.]MDZ4100984.1 AAA family ATPase [Hydrogenophaga sp.]MDZ4293522.1 AAA family ATPase [Hydrogenophaga sp.]
MYLEHFGLREWPFSITPDTSFFFSSDSAQGGLNLLLIAARTGEGFIKITGEVGTGKTLLCRLLMQNLGPAFKVAYLPNPYLEPMSLYLELAYELGITWTNTHQLPSQHALIKELSQVLIDLAGEGLRTVVCLDEAQAMPIETLEALRLLTNLETEKRKLLQVIIFGQPELEEKLNHPSVRQLKQRITFDYRLTPLAADDLNYYLHHRLKVAGHQGGRVFSQAAIRLITRQTGGSPRLINIVAHKALMAAYGKGKKMADYFDVRAAGQDTPSVKTALWHPLWSIGAALVLIVGLAAAVHGMPTP